MIPRKTLVQFLKSQVNCCSLCHRPLFCWKSITSRTSITSREGITSRAGINPHESNRLLLSERINHSLKVQVRRTVGQRTTKPWEGKKSPVIEIRDGQYTPKAVAKLMKRDVSEVYECMDILGFKNINPGNVVHVFREFGFRIKRAELNRDEKEDTIPELPIKPGSIMIPKPPVVTIMGHVDHGKTTILDSLRKSEIVKQEFGGITQHIGAFVVSLDQPGKVVDLDTFSTSSKVSNSPVIPSLSNDASSQKFRKDPSSQSAGEKVSAKKSIKNLVTFLDTPGHAAFHAMRQRGANVTDIVVLVVAADDGVMDQTIESIKFAKNANVPIVIAVNKMDKVNRNDSKIFDTFKRGLMTEGIILEEDGGEFQSVKVSGLTGEGLNDLKEAILAQAELLELFSTADGTVTGTVIESLLDPRRGRLATILIKTGTLRRGDIIVAGDTHYAKVRSMFDEWGKVINSVGPGFPVQVIGWKDSIPDAGDSVTSVESEAIAKDYIKVNTMRLKESKSLQDIFQYRKKQDEELKEYKEHLEHKRSSDSTYAKYWSFGKKSVRKKQTTDGDDEDKINLILKADVNGTLQVLLDVVANYPNDREIIKVNIIHFGVGPVTETDLELASAFPNTFIYGFNVKNDSKIISAGKKLSVPIKDYNVIYHLVDDLKKEISARLPELDSETIAGEATVQQEFLINEKNRKRPVAGCRCIRGALKKSPDHLYKLIRGDTVIVDRMQILSMRHLKDEVNEIKNGVECGLRFEVINTSQDVETNEEITTAEDVRFQPGDRIVSYTIKKVKQETKWTPPGF